MQEGFDFPTNSDNMSPLQYITRQAEEAESKIYTEPGYVCVHYKFDVFNISDSDSSDEDEEITTILNRLKNFRKFHLRLLLKGFVSHTLKNRTNVKVDYARFNLTAN